MKSKIAALRKITFSFLYTALPKKPCWLSIKFSSDLHKTAALLAFTTSINDACHHCITVRLQYWLVLRPWDRKLHKIFSFSLCMLIILIPYGYYSYSHQVAVVISACCPFSLSAFASVQPQFVRLFVCGQRSLSFPHTIFFNGNTYLFFPSTLQAGPLLWCTWWGSRRWRRGILASFGDTLLTCSLTLYGCHCEAATATVTVVLGSFWCCRRHNSY